MVWWGELVFCGCKLEGGAFRYSADGSGTKFSTEAEAPKSGESWNTSLEILRDAFPICQRAQQGLKHIAQEVGKANQAEEFGYQITAANRGNGRPARTCFFAF